VTCWLVKDISLSERKHKEGLHIIVWVSIEGVEERYRGYPVRCEVESAYTKIRYSSRKN
jgi:hypothetical protein